ncbi:tRNA cyclic N6-threonylcarbamoyladenosine(37) synthase TcdA [Thiohalobacter thiocyanaticus]|uniref:tRNA cyclic N6-threonylcarbamoyladenosine(37) synthase TcdA n=1 Tax=Thiohalobacter thiocyanaticus TaxID=585455 RepID=A0A426QGU0_9GAMM|nr:tRNA cyclic N6-threonylcarbamoyladenosine(37) synthase TcdA [Thiohalobacter thiocyanaticus]RRQ20978.1 tRNA cyclic N6-threonylcarbamoyladenosine(37) synthase TcdA [Thiohalobacter thiocyanaticus]
MDSYAERFDGVRRLYGEAAFARIPELHLCVVGLGGVGSWAVEALARTGVGRLTLIDHDDISPSNVNRQLHSLSDTLGRSKVEVMIERVKQINPWCEVDAVDDFLTSRNLWELLPLGYDHVIDAIDSIRFKADMIYFCKRNRIPIITTGGAGGLTDPTAIRITDLTRTWNDALAAKVRSRLRANYNWTRNPTRRFGIECVFSTEQPVYPKPDGSVCPAKPGIHGVHLDCTFGYGSSVAVTAGFGFTAAARALERALKNAGVTGAVGAAPAAAGD